MVLQREDIVNTLKSQIRITGHVIGVAVGAGITQSMRPEAVPTFFWP